MRVVYTDEALSDLNETLAYIDANYPVISAAFRQALSLRGLGHGPKAPRKWHNGPACVWCR
jgi:hypothetical protein